MVAANPGEIGGGAGAPPARGDQFRKLFPINSSRFSTDHRFGGAVHIQEPRVQEIAGIGGVLKRTSRQTEVGGSVAGSSLWVSLPILHHGHCRNHRSDGSLTVSHRGFAVVAARGHGAYQR